MVEVKGIGQIAMLVSDLARSKHFYAETLGLTVLFEAGGMVFFECGGLRLMLGTVGAPGMAAGASGIVLYFKVDDIVQTHAAMVQAGVKFLRGPTMVAKMPDHELWMAGFTDPDGYVAELMCEVR